MYEAIYVLKRGFSEEVPENRIRGSDTDEKMVGDLPGCIFHVFQNSRTAGCMER
jgi:hypothetical protein